MKIDNEDKQFELQARTDLAEGANGTTINATVFSAFAARDDTGSFVQVELSRLKDSKLSGQIPDQAGLPCKLECIQRYNGKISIFFQKCILEEMTKT